VTICSIDSFQPNRLAMEYGAAKAALSNFCKALSKEVGKHDIRVNTVSPGAVATDSWLGRDGIAEFWKVGCYSRKARVTAAKSGELTML